MSNTQLNKDVYWVGYVDWDVRDFHGYTTKRGSTYNSYIIKDEKIAVVDSVKAPYAEDLVANILKHTDLDKINYVICNHAEPDHSGSIPVLMDICPNAELVCNEKCKKALGMHYDIEGWKFKVVDEQSELSLGKNTLKFINTPMAHWPESMMTYMVEHKLLFSMDAFGQHYASAHRFAFEEPLDTVIHEAKVYYSNIVMLYGGPIKAALQKAAGIEIDMIAPSHGVIWTKKYLPEIINCYSSWIECKPRPKILIFFDTMWKSTGMMASAILEGANLDEVEVKKYDLKFTNITDLATESIDSAVIAVGSPTLNKGLMPKVAEALTYLKGLAPKGKSAIAFGSYGWAKKGGQHEVYNYLENMGCNMLINEPIQCQFVPTEEILEECRKAGRLLAEKALEIAKNQ